jgi:phage shock protein A
LKASPLLTISELLWLKVDDIDSRVDHLEKMLAQIIDDNKLLQRKVNALEQQKHLRDLRDSKRRVLIEELD